MPGRNGSRGVAPPVGGLTSLGQPPARQGAARVAHPAFLALTWPLGKYTLVIPGHWGENLTYGDRNG
jgi:hypothetical protein